MSQKTILALCVFAIVACGESSRLSQDELAIATASVNPTAAFTSAAEHALDPAPLLQDTARTLKRANGLWKKPAVSFTSLKKRVTDAIAAGKGKAGDTDERKFQRTNLVLSATHIEQLYFQTGLTKIFSST